ncbi:MAG: Gfo/Idh/MocA family oxidoreductase [Candidatus Woesearchaeota archaeon]
MVETLKAGVIGCGLMGQNHVRNYIEIEETELVAICDVNKKTADSLAKKYKCKAYNDYEEMLSKEKLDIVSVAVPTFLHKKVGLEVLKKNINMLLEKPITLSLEEADELITASKKSSSKVLIGHIERFNSAVMEAKERIKEIGKLICISARRIGPYASRIQDTGVVIDLTTHDIDSSMFIAESEVKELFGYCSSLIKKDREDFFVGIMNLKNDLNVLLETNWITPTKIRELNIIGTRGMFKVDYVNQDLYFYENAELKEMPNYQEVLKGVTDGIIIKYKVDKKEPLRNEIMHLIECIRKDKSPLVTLEIGKKNLLIAKKFLESAKEKKIVRF